MQVNRGSVIRVQKNVYSVHSRLIGEHVDVRVYADQLEVLAALEQGERATAGSDEGTTPARASYPKRRCRDRSRSLPIYGERGTAPSHSASFRSPSFPERNAKTIA